MYKSMQLIDMLKKKHTFRSDNDVAKKLGISRSAVSRYRNGTGSIDDKLAVEIAEMLIRLLSLHLCAANALHVTTARPILTSGVNTLRNNDLLASPFNYGSQQPVH